MTYAILMTTVAGSPPKHGNIIPRHAEGGPQPHLWLDLADLHGLEVADGAERLLVLRHKRQAEFVHLQRLVVVLVVFIAGNQANVTD